MADLGFYWDDYAKQFKATTDTITAIQTKIDELKAENEQDGNLVDHTAEINEL